MFTPLQLSDFDYPLPDHLVAQAPNKDTQQNRLLVREKDGTVHHSHIKNLWQKIPQDALVVANDTRVIPGRIKGIFDTGGKFEIMLLSPRQDGRFHAMGKPFKKFRKGRLVQIDEKISLEVTALYDGATPTMEVAFNVGFDVLYGWLKKFGYIPLPPYIKREMELPAATSKDSQSYQTAYACHDGSVAAPTAGLHFNDELLLRLKEKGVQWATVTHHVGAGTFLPVKVSDVSQHEMHTEEYSVPEKTHELIQKFKKENRPIVCVGTTSFRCVESFYQDGLLNPKKTDTWHKTGLFVYPRHDKDLYKPKVPSILMTNFHQPCSTLFMLICALVGTGNAKELYNEAVKEEYRFFSYGDSSLLWL